MGVDEPEVEMMNDYEGWFEAFVRRLIRQKKEAGQPFKSRTVVIVVRPFVPYSVKYEQWKDDQLYLEFYSALRRGFGTLSEEDQQGIRDLL